ncbi:unnamed protein product [Ixodes pacificus]
MDCSLMSLADDGCACLSYGLLTFGTSVFILLSFPRFVSNGIGGLCSNCCHPLAVSFFLSADLWKLWNVLCHPCDASALVFLLKGDALLSFCFFSHPTLAFFNLLIICFCFDQFHVRIF